MYRVIPVLAVAAGYLVAATPSGTLAAAPGSPFTAGANPGAITTGDFNGDGKPDLAVANRTASNGGVNILLGDGNGGFTLAPAIVVGGSPWALATGDFNGDKKLDLVVASYSSGNVTVLLGDGAGGFARAGTVIATGTGPSAVVTADFNKDGKLDFAVANLYGGIAVLLGNGAGLFSPAIGSPFPAGNGPIALAVGDFDGDGTPDIVVANYFGDPVDNSGGANGYFSGQTVTVLRGNGIGSFIRPLVPTARTGGLDPDALTVGDFNGDGRPDVAVANFTSNAVTVLPGNGFGSFLPFTGIPIPTGNAPTSVTSADFDGDGLPDLAVTNQVSNSVAILLGSRAGGFGPPSAVFPAIAAPLSVATADFNGDGRADLATANFTGTVTVLLGAPAQTSVTLTMSGSTAVRAQVAAAANSFHAPAGSVSLLDGSAVRATVALTDGVAAFDISNLSAGAHNLTATYNGDSSTVMSTSTVLTVTVSGAPVTLNGVANGASFLAGAAAPNTILSLFGSNLGCTPAPEVQINHVAAEVLGATDGQINFVVPQMSGTLVLEVVCGGTRSPGLTLQSAVAAPAIFTANFSGTGQGSIVNFDGSLNANRAAARGEYISVYGTGFGELAPPDASGLRRLVRQPSAFIGDVQTDVQFAGAAPGYTTGLQQINVLVPANAPTGAAVAIRLTVDGISTQSGVTVGVR